MSNHQHSEDLKLMKEVLAGGKRYYEILTSILEIDLLDYEEKFNLDESSRMDHLCFWFSIKVFAFQIENDLESICPDLVKKLTSVAQVASVSLGKQVKLDRFDIH